MTPPPLYDQDVNESRGARRSRASGPAPGLTSRQGRQVPGGQTQKQQRPGTGFATGAQRLWRGHVGWMLPLTVLVVSLLVLTLLVRSRIADEPVAAPAEGAVGGTSITAAGPASLIIHVTETGEAVGFTVFALDGGAAGEPKSGLVLFVPASTMVEIPGFGLDRIAEAYGVGGAELAGLTLRNLLSVDFEHVDAVDAARFTALIRGVGDLTIDNPSVVDTITTSGRVETLWPAGAVVVPANDASAFLEARAVDESDLDRLVRHQAFWKALLAARADVAESVDEPEADIDAFLDTTAVNAERLTYRILPVETMGGSQELYGVDREALADLQSRLAPGVTNGAQSRTTVQLLNGVGIPGLAEPVTALVLAADVTVELTGNALQFGHETTQIVYYRDDQVEAALRIRDRLGVGEVVKQRDPIDVVDVTIVIGADLVAVINADTER
ncbi:MAG: hypothetical protein ACI8Y4_002145 [Candidatus Poriferisodalaceae bacterium]